MPAQNVQPLCVLIDGRSGAGKTTFAQRLSQRMEAQLIHLEDVYPGWDGLAAATRILEESILCPDVHRAGFYPWDWHAHRTADQWVSVQPGLNLVVEGCGAISHDTIVAAQRNYHVVSIDIEVPVDVRKPRALRRSPEMTDFWDMWAAQEDQHRATMPVPDMVLGESSLERLDIYADVIPRHIRGGQPHQGIDAPQK